MKLKEVLCKQSISVGLSERTIVLSAHNKLRFAWTKDALLTKSSGSLGDEGGAYQCKHFAAIGYNS